MELQVAAGRVDHVVGVQGEARGVGRRFGSRLALGLIASLLFALSLAPAAHAVSPEFFGLSSTEGYLDQESDWNLIQRSGVTLFRMQINWALVNKNGPGFYDNRVKAAADRGIRILPVLSGAKILGSNRFPTEGTAEYDEWAGFVSSIAARYGIGGSFWAGYSGTPREMLAWEVWNEPNLAVNNPAGLNKAQPQNYARFLNYTKNAIHSVQPPSTRVLFGGLVTAGTGENNLPIQEFLTKAAEVPGTASAFDGLSLHPYEKGVAGVTGVVRKTRETLTASFGAAKTIWITELGWPLASGDSNHPKVPENEQATLLTNSFNELKQQSAFWHIEYLAWYFYRDADEGSPLALGCENKTPCWANHAGLVGSNRSLHPSWFAFLAQTGAPAAPAALAENLFAIGSTETGSKTTEIHVLDGLLGYTKFLGHNPTVLGETTSAHWQFSMQDYNRDTLPDLMGVAMNGTGSGRTEVHLVNAASNYQTFLFQGATGLGETNASQWRFGFADVNHDGRPDLLAIAMNGTGSKSTEVHVLNGADGFTSFLGHNITPLGETQTSQWQFGFGDVNRDGFVDILAIALNGTGSHRIEVHVLSGATSYTTYLTHAISPLGEVTASQWQFSAADVNHDGFIDVIGTNTSGTATGQTEVHILNGASTYSSFLWETATALGPANPSGWQFAPLSP
jgi:Glycosyl hydrolase catalytic core